MRLKSIGILLLLAVILLGTAAIKPIFLSADNVQSLIRWTSLFGLCSIGVAFVIITGGIDLSIGSTIALSGCLLVIVLDGHYVKTNEYFAVTDIRNLSEENQSSGTLIAIDGREYQFAVDDQFLYQSPSGRSISATVREVRFIDGDRWLLLRRDNGTLSVGTELEWRAFQHRSVPMAIAIVVGFAMLIGLLHGLLITKVGLQPFVVTLCGLLIYRGAARVLAGDQPLGFGTTLEPVKNLINGNSFSIPVPFIPQISQGQWGVYAKDQSGELILDAEGNAQLLNLIGWVELPVFGILLIVIGLIASIILNRTIFGRHLLAMGNNLSAAKFSGINTDRITIAAYVICSAMAGISGVLFTFDLNSVQPSSSANFYELYAIAAAVLGGCSLRGGSGSVWAAVLGTAVMRSLYLAIASLELQKYEFMVIGFALLIAVLADEIIRWISNNRQLAKQKKTMQQSLQSLENSAAISNAVNSNDTVQS